MRAVKRFELAGCFLILVFLAFYLVFERVFNHLRWDEQATFGAALTGMHSLSLTYWARWAVIAVVVLIPTTGLMAVFFRSRTSRSRIWIAAVASALPFLLCVLPRFPLLLPFTAVAGVPHVTGQLMIGIASGATHSGEYWSEACLGILFGAMSLWTYFWLATLLFELAQRPRHAPASGQSTTANAV